MTYREFLTHLAKGPFYPAYLFTGEEELLVEEGTQRLIAKLVGESPPSESLVQVSGEESTDLSSLLTSPSLWSSRLVVIVKEAQSLPPQTFSIIVQFVKSPLEGTTLILWEGEAKRKRVGGKGAGKESKGGKGSPNRDRVKPLTWDDVIQAIAQSGGVVECGSLTGRARVFWMDQFLTEKGKKLSEGAKERILAMEWPSLRDLKSELERLCLWIGDKNLIDIEDLEGAGGVLIPTARYKVVEGLLTGDSKRFYHTCQSLMGWGLQPNQLLGDLTRFFLRLWTIQEYRESARKQGRKEISESDREMVKRLTDLGDFLIPKYLAAAQKWSKEAVQEILHKLYQTEFQIKIGELDAEVGVDQLIITIIGYIPYEMRKVS